MYCNFTKCQAFPLAIRASSQQPRCFIPFYINPKKPQCSPNSYSKSPFCCSSVRFIEKSHEYYQLLGPKNRDSSVSFSQQYVVKKKNQVCAAKNGCFANGFHSKPRKFSTSYSRKLIEGSDEVKPLPWLAKNKDKEMKNTENLVSNNNVRSSWEESAEKFLKNGVANEDKGRRFDRRNDYKERNMISVDESPKTRSNRSSWEESAENFVKSGANGVENRGKSRRFDRRNDYKERNMNSVAESPKTRSARSSWEESAEKFVKSGSNGVENREKSRRFDRRDDHKERRGSFEDEFDSQSQEIDKPRWYKMVDAERNSNGNEFRKWNREDSWGKKTWREATESSIPKMVGECVYGVGPVLAALSANRREFYTLYVQEGLDLNGNSKKKKDKKGFEKVLRVVEKLGLTKKEMSKHDLNMIVDNRPHQGLVLDASPLEMVNIRELDRVVANGEDNCPLWVALDEVTDPQNLGAIIRSSYFFGASGVVLCAKNSAPLSGVVSKASAGSLELTELRCCKNMMQFLVSSSENGWRVLGGSVSSKAVSLNEVKRGEPTILVLGSEGTGLRPLVERSCTQLIKIAGNIPVHLSAGLEDVETEEFKSFLAVESLNVSVAAGVLLHHLVGSKDSKRDDQIEG